MPKDARQYVPSFRAGQPTLLHSALRDAAQESRGLAGIQFEGANTSYAEMDVLSDRLAARLLACGIQPGDRVILGLPNSSEFFIVCFAIWKVGAIVIPLDTAIRPTQLQDIIGRTEPTALVADPNFAKRVLELSEALQSFRVFFVKGPGPCKTAASCIPVESLAEVFASDMDSKGLPVDVKPEDVATITFTSGSTGLPKGVMHTHQSCIACATFTRDFLGLSPNDLTAIPLPLHHVLAFRRVLTCILAKCSAVIAPDIFAALKVIPTLRPTGLVLVPAACNIMIDNFASFLRDNDGIVRYIEIGSAPMSRERLSSLQAILPSTQIHVTYGLTEGRVGYLKTGPSGSFNLLACSNDGLQVQVVDKDGHPVRDGETGEILLTGSGLMRGYWGQPVSEQERLATHGFRTGDMGRADGRGNVELLGRLDDILKIGGHKVNPREIETVINQHPAVGESVIVGLPDPQGILELTLHAYVVLKKGASCTSAELTAHCRKCLELYKVPVKTHFCSSFPKTPLGKIQRHLVIQSASNELDLLPEN